MAGDREAEADILAGALKVPFNTDALTEWRRCPARLPRTASAADAGHAALECRDVSVDYGDVRALADVGSRLCTGPDPCRRRPERRRQDHFRPRRGGHRPAAYRARVSIAGRDVPAGNVSDAAQPASNSSIRASPCRRPSPSPRRWSSAPSGRPRIYTRRSCAPLGAASRRARRPGPPARADPRPAGRDAAGRRDRPRAGHEAQGPDPRRADRGAVAVRHRQAVRAAQGHARRSGVTIILILHKIREVLAIADTVTVLRGGRLVEGPVSTSPRPMRRTSPLRSSAAELELTLIRRGRRRRSSARPRRARRRGPGHRLAEPQAQAAPILELRGPSPPGRSRGPGRSTTSRSASRRGEIVGVAGVEGNGQRTLVRAISHLADLDRRRHRARRRRRDAAAAQRAPRARGCGSSRSSGTARASACRARSGRTGRRGCCSSAACSS